MKKNNYNTKTITWILTAVTILAVMIGHSLWRRAGTKSVVCGAGACGLLPHKQGKVMGIVYAEGNPSAVITSKVVHEGDTIDGVKVIKIHNDKVEFEKNGKKWTQRLQENPNNAWQE